MKYLNSKVLKRPKQWKNDGKYLVTLEVTDKDILLLEDLAMCYVTKGSVNKQGVKDYDESHELDDAYKNFCNRTFYNFHLVWVKHDIDGCDEKSFRWLLRHRNNPPKSTIFRKIKMRRKRSTN